MRRPRMTRQDNREISVEARLTTSLQDLITDDELISDSYDLKEIDGTVYEADCKKITIGNDNIGQSTSVAWTKDSG